MDAIGLFEADANAGKLSAEAAATQGHDLEKSIDRAIFRAKERFGQYLANSESKENFAERWAEVKAKGLISVVATATKPTPGVLRRVENALRPPLPQAKAPAKKAGSTPSTKTAAVVTAAVKKTAWAFDKSTNLYTSNDPMQKFACPSCGHEQDALGFTKCACGKQWNSWPVRQAGGAKTGASTYILMAREIKMRGDQFKLAAMGNVKPAGFAEAVVAKTADGPPPGMSQPTPGTMPGDNSGATGAPVPPEQPSTPGANSPDGDNDVAGGVTEGSPIDQIQDALGDAINALKDVQMLSVNPQLAAMGGLKLSAIAAAKVKGEKIENLRNSMDRFWKLHREMNYVAGQLAKEANEAIQSIDPRVSEEAEFSRGYYAAARNEPLPAKTGKVWLEGYVAYHKFGDTYDTGADIGRTTVPGAGQDKTNGSRNEGTFVDGGLDDAVDTERNDAGPFDTTQPASKDFAGDTDARNSKGMKDNGDGQSSTLKF